jgi:hypothetical protein
LAGPLDGTVGTQDAALRDGPKETSESIGVGDHMKPRNPFDSVLQRAKEYPYDLMDRSYVLINDEVFAFATFEDSWETSEVEAGNRRVPLSTITRTRGFPDETLKAHRTPVLAIGSNGSPSQLRTKFGREENTVLPVAIAELTNMDVVYSAHFSRYACVPANLLKSNGTKVRVYVTYLTDRQLRTMNESEARNYDPIELNGINLLVQGRGRIRSILCYLSRHGCLRLDNQPVRVAAFPAIDSQFPAMTEERLLGLLVGRLAPEKSIDMFIEDLIEDSILRYSFTRQIRRDSVPFDWPDWRIVEELNK